MKQVKPGFKMKSRVEKLSQTKGAEAKLQLEDEIDVTQAWIMSQKIQSTDSAFLSFLSPYYCRF